MNFDVDTLPGSCGVGVLYSFSNNFGYSCEDLLNGEGRAGCGWYVVAFVDTEACHKMYQECCEKLKLVFQSEVRLNMNSNNEFFFCIFDAGEPEVAEDDDWEDDDDF